MAKPRYQSQPGPRRVSQGSVSRPKALPKWRPRRQVGDPPRRVSNPQTIV